MGADSVAYQVEGICNYGGKGPFVWDIYTKISRITFQNTNRDVVDDDYNSYAEGLQFYGNLIKHKIENMFSIANQLPELNNMQRGKRK